MEFSAETITLLFFVAMLAGWVDVIAGGGGLLTIPALIMVGVPPAAALATNKLQGSVGTLIASLYFLKNRAIEFGEIKWLLLSTFIGSVFGSWLLLQIDADSLTIFLPLLLIATGVYFLSAPNIDDRERTQKISLLAVAILVAPLLGFYDGFFGPGTGSFMALAFVSLCGYSLSRATANAKILNFTSNIASLLYFIVYGDIYWLLGLIMIGGQTIGAVFGAKTVMKKGARLIKPVVVIVCFLMAITILVKQITA